MQFSIYHSVAILALLVAGAEMCSDLNPSCPNWVANGFCTSTFYTDTQKTQYCPASCGLCSGVSSTGASASTASSSSSGVCVDNASNCKTWNDNGFCDSTFYTTQQKKQYCGYTCNLCNSDSLNTVGGASDSTTQATATTSA
ncbi:hypothetical protein CRE_15277 [Caenorhabditis remanei]|uniref:Uncharacterized protein n=1 Tax=Caenorhabditis remanei TaxID=31234 RepID=E3MBZ7_CAERE|nr:hypothetical protein CRE_15277 [Caenorhabditis remanei]